MGTSRVWVRRLLRTWGGCGRNSLRPRYPFSNIFSLQRLLHSHLHLPPPSTHTFTCPLPAQLNTASYINVVAEPEEQAVALEGLAVNIADQTIYPGSMKW